MDGYRILTNGLLIQSIYVLPVWQNAGTITFPISFTRRPVVLSGQSTEGKHFSGGTSIIYLTNRNFKLAASLNTDACNAGAAIIAIGF